MSRFSSMSDEFYVNMTLNTEMQLPKTRETVLHFFELLKKAYPSMGNFYARDQGEFVLEEAKKEGGAYRWASVEPKRICSGAVNPESLAEAMSQHHQLLELAPYSLSLSPLDCESINITYGFDFNYRGNHNQLLIDALGISPALEKLVDLDDAKVVSNEPSIQLAFGDDCRIQCRISFETRTSAYHVRTGDFPEEQLSVYVTARRYGSLNNETYGEVLSSLSALCERLIDEQIAENILLPLQQTILLQ